jgi:thioredoxin-related protein
MFSSMKRLILLSIGVLVTFVQALAADGWLTDFEQAKAKAQESHKPILALFTGSDWCPGCIRLQKEVLGTPEFTDYTAKNVVLLEVDFPIKKELPKEQKKANQKLESKYDIDGYPTFIVIDPKGKKVATIDVLTDDAKQLVAKIEQAVKKAPKS